MVEWTTNDELERIWKEMIVAQKHYLDIFMEGMNKTTENLSEDILCACRNSNRWLPEWEYQYYYLFI
jgi:hypothetical protein